MFNVRRLMLLSELAVGMTLCHTSVRHLTHVAWLMIFGLIWLVSDQSVPPGKLAMSVLLFACIAVIIVFDARYYIIPDRQLLVLVCAISVYLGFTNPSDLAVSWGAGILSAVSMLAVAALYESIRSRPGLGLGDTKFVGVAGVWLGFEGLPTCLLIATFSALVSIAIQRCQGQPIERKSAIPFGPHLAIGVWAAWCIATVAPGAALI
jgi:leader peptidase (prepilin peptidase) / N-methyltransferase